jgi:hypothetical protein
MADAMMRDEFEAMVIERVWRDPTFRERLLKDPKKAIESEFGRNVASDCEIVVVEESERRLGIVIPAPPAGAQEKALNDQELEKVAGGACFPPIGTAVSWRSKMQVPALLSIVSRR